MKKIVLSLLCPVLLSACVGMPKNQDPDLMPVTKPQLTEVMANHENNLIDKISENNQQLNQSNQALILSLQQEVRSLRDNLPSFYRTSEETMNIQHNDATAYPENVTPDGKMILGESETVWLDAVASEFSARVDTGAATSSLNASDINIFERDGKPWVSFKLPITDNNESMTLELPIVRQVRIRQASAEELELRPVVELTIRLGSHIEKAEFTLSDRSKMNHPVLLGREFLKDIAVVDIARKNAQGKPSIPTDKSP